METGLQTTVTLLGEKHLVGVDRIDFATREDLVATFSRLESVEDGRQSRLAAATVGLCTRIGRRANVELAACGYDVLGYGTKVYDYLRRQNVNPTELGQAAGICLNVLVESMAPTQAELKAAEGFSGAGAGPAT